eukprot:3139259-Rhodomonas_salina.1
MCIRDSPIIIPPPPSSSKLPSTSAVRPNAVTPPAPPTPTVKSRRHKRQRCRHKRKRGFATVPFTQHERKRLEARPDALASEERDTGQ